ncbi:MAG TPA: hypothetical protein VEH57_03290 [Thermoplasmata archaeon]|nr:hypothetical protein [Thermoplasmata archaeon]
MRPLGALFPWQLVGVAVLLLALVVFTPVLLSSGTTPFLTRAELVVDRTAGGNTTNFYVHAIGATVRYQRISMAVATDFNWTGGYPSGALLWAGWQNGTDVVELSLFTIDLPVALFVEATYSGSSSTTTYAGLLAFTITSLGLPSETLDTAVSSTTSGVSVPSTVLISNLPVTILLPVFTGGGLP